MLEFLFLIPFLSFVTAFSSEKRRIIFVGEILNVDKRFVVWELFPSFSKRNAQCDFFKVKNGYGISTYRYCSSGEEAMQTDYI